MIEKKIAKNRRFMSGFELTESESNIKIGAGTLDNFTFGEIEFDLIFDDEQEVLHDLYIVQLQDGYDYRY
ncbi:hypothetical protein DFO70_11774 [Cytobacillus firmus]|uniref:Uncharacterized protein n=2 Tax=Cytobacillus TaxID=2675230 RepID=A0A366JK98_CYTFI|nr:MULTISPECIES: hypothetical protein [Cytobacillus]RBP87883.1 hypothetical protein DFO70_11774 [Cytobacillus firmus]TDX39246.1 hypothetical protein DFO72_11176 [Cytobacillus oceanisediminis]